MTKSRDKKKKITILLTIVILCIFTTIAGIVIYTNSLLDKVETVDLPKNDLAISPEVEENHGEVRNIALFGIDEVDGINGRSDSIMILTLDSLNNKIKLTSIMRDSYVNIQGYGMDKINHAYAFGGPELAIKTLNENFNLNIKEFMTVNFTSLPIIIDKLGGVSIDITSEEVIHIPEITSAGTYNLTGAQALKYARIRYASGGDYKRTERHRTIVDAIFGKIKKISVTKYPSLIGEFLPYVTTNMTSSDMMNLLKDFAGLISLGLQQDRFPRDEESKGQMIDGVYYLTFNREVVRKDIYEYIFEN